MLFVYNLAYKTFKKTGQKKETKTRQTIEFLVKCKDKKRKEN